ncbi:hypothetical protein FSP39_010451 [Pinctada imbricata]|uniref:KY-like immunoglobulin-like domain-containing protein n=1 Tax=Pinctada imbricata TaxID=66713 RepID=A0AA88YG10_PINIB|nr:hypothetical protein FSP39_010451 [Pinctada imbricata]
MDLAPEPPKTTSQVSFMLDTPSPVNAPSPGVGTPSPGPDISTSTPSDRDDFGPPDDDIEDIDDIGPAPPPNGYVTDNYFSSLGAGALRPSTADTDIDSIPLPEGFGNKKFNPEQAVCGMKSEKDAVPFWKKHNPLIGGSAKGGKGKGGKGFATAGPVISADTTREKQLMPGGEMVEIRNGKRFTTRQGRSTPFPEEEVIERISQMDRKNPKVQFATMKYTRKAKFSETYRLWTTDMHLLTELPPPHPPFTRKIEIFDPAGFKRADKKYYRVPKKVVNYPLSEMVDHLTKKCRDDISKVRAIYVWLTSLNVPKLTLPIKPTRECTCINYIEKIKKKKCNYAELISHMCNLAGLPCVVIHGYLKGSSYEIGEPLNPDTHYGEWNAVLVDNSWRLINAYWGACSVGSDIDESDITTYRTDENFFLTDPDQLAYSHYPTESKWQLLDPPMTLEEFETKAYLKERFFELEMRVLSHPRCEVQVENGHMELLFGINPARIKNYRFMTLVYMNQSKGFTLLYDDENRYQQDFMCFPNKGSVKFKIRFPKPGNYRVEIVGKDITIDQPKYDYDWIAIYKIKVNTGPVKYSAFPKCAEAGWGNHDALKEVGLAPATKLENACVMADDGYCRIAFKFESSKGRECNLTYKLVDVNRGLDEVKIEKGGFQTFQDEEFLLKLHVPTGDEIAFCCFTEVEDDTYGTIEKNLCNYLIMSVQARQLDQATNAIVSEGRNILDDALHFKQIELIERAVDLIETRRHEGHMLKQLNEAKELAVRLKKVTQLMHDVLALNQKLVAELRSYQQPLPEVHDIMKATFLLLGNFEEETRITGITAEVKKRKADMLDKTKPRISSDPKKQLSSRMSRSVEVEFEEEPDEVLKDAIRFKQLELIERAIDLVETRRHEGHMQKELNEAKRLARRLRKVSKLMHDVLALNQIVITEISAYSTPPQAVHDTMKATFLLLGNYESETKIEITYRISWRSSYSSNHHCDSNTIADDDINDGEGSLICRTCSPQETIGRMNYKCTDFSEIDDWTTGINSIIFDYGSRTEFYIGYSSSAWISLQYGGSAWSVMTLVKTSVRNDTQIRNTSPITSMQPITRLSLNCKYQIKIPVNDIDGDFIRCRWAESSIYPVNECGGVCDALPGSNLTEETCELHYTANEAGYFAVAIQIEDFISSSSTTPLSSDKTETETTDSTTTPAMTTWEPTFNLGTQILDSTTSSMASTPGLTEIETTDPTKTTVLTTCKLKKILTKISTALTIEHKIKHRRTPSKPEVGPGAREE